MKHYYAIRNRNRNSSVKYLKLHIIPYVLLLVARFTLALSVPYDTQLDQAERSFRADKSRVRVSRNVNYRRVHDADVIARQSRVNVARSAPHPQNTSTRATPQQRRTIN